MIEFALGQFSGILLAALAVGVAVAWIVWARGGAK